MRRLGVHTSISGGLARSLERARDLGCDTLQIFSHNPRSWTVHSISDEDAAGFRLLRRELDMSPVFVHASYLLNVASRDDLLRRKSLELLVAEMSRADTIGADYVILHPGSASGDDEGVARTRAVQSLNEVSLSGRWKAGLLLENEAGRRGDISSQVRHLAEMADGVRGALIRGVCLDTCHAHAAGYDIGGKTGIRTLLREIERHLGADRIKLIHLNDSKGDAGSRTDRHEHLGLGKIGIDGLRRFIEHKPFRNIPLILETPKKSEADDRENLEKARKMLRTKLKFKN